MDRIYTIGRAPDNSTVINKPDVSNYHARITITETDVVMEDLDSTNGTYINGFRIKEAILNCRDKVTISKQYTLSEDFLLKIFRHIDSQVNPNDYTKEFLSLKEVYEKYHKEKKESIKRNALTNNLIRLAVVSVPSISFVIIAKPLFKDANSYFPWYLALNATLPALLPFINRENRRGAEIEREFRRRYRCPKCKTPFTQEWQFYNSEGVCPVSSCKAILSE